MRTIKKIVQMLTASPPEEPHHKYAAVAVIGHTSKIYPEAIIQNLRKEREAISIGENTHIQGRLRVRKHGGHISIGDWCYVGEHSEIWSSARIEIGNRVLISHNVNIHDSNAHPVDPVERHQHFREIMLKGHPASLDGLYEIDSSPIIIEDDVWINFGVSILKGVRIGHGSIIAAGSIVTKDVPPQVVYCCEITPKITPLS